MPVLLVGRDPALLDTRRLVLHVSGFEARLAHGILDLELIPLEPKPTAVVICHDFPDAEHEQAMRIARRRWPGSRIVLLCHEEIPTASDLSLVSSLRGPEPLIDALLMLRREREPDRKSANGGWAGRELQVG